MGGAFSHSHDAAATEVVPPVAPIGNQAVDSASQFQLMPIDEHDLEQHVEHPPLPKHLETRIESANEVVEHDYQHMLGVYKNMKKEMESATRDWSQHSARLKGTCDAISESLMEMSKNYTECDEAQNDDLGAIMKVRASNPDFKMLIQGCVDTKQADKLTPTQDCTCMAGEPLQGCADALSDSDHRLACMHLRKKMLPLKQLHHLFWENGPCNVDNLTSWNKDSLAPEQPPDFKIAAYSMPSPEMLAAFLELRPMMVKRQHQRPEPPKARLADGSGRLPCAGNDTAAAASPAAAAAAAAGAGQLSCGSFL